MVNYRIGSSPGVHLLVCHCFVSHNLYFFTYLYFERRIIKRLVLNLGLDIIEQKFYIYLNTLNSLTIDLIYKQIYYFLQ